jgi:hypothetical protein
MEAIRNAYNILVGKPEGKRPLGRPKNRWENNISIDLWEIGWESMGLMHQEPVTGSCDHSNEPSGSIRDGEFLA